MTSKSVSIRIPLGLYEILEREAIDRKMAIAQVIIERLSRTERIVEAPRIQFSRGSIGVADGGCLTNF